MTNQKNRPESRTGNPPACKATSIGGQALIEGIMMRGPQRTALACRLPDGGISVEEIKETRLKDKYKILGLPILRGTVNFVESMVFGYKAMMISAERSGMLDEDEEEAPHGGAGSGEQADENAAGSATHTAQETAPAQSAQSPQRPDAGQTDAQPGGPRAETAAFSQAQESVPAAAGGSGDIAQEASGSTAQAAQAPDAGSATAQDAVAQAPDTDDAADAAVSQGAGPDDAAQVKTSVPDGKSGEADKDKNGVLMGVIGSIAVVLGVALAVFLFMFLPTKLFDLVNRLSGEMLTNWRALFEGVVKIVIFVAYISIVSLMKEIHRVFMYHGAEHKSIFCYEKGLPLTVENVRIQRRFHPRCGTSFLILMLLVSIVFYAILSICVPILTKYALVWVAFKILMLPVICGIGYELIKFCGRHDNLLTKIISAPGMWLQRVTTKEPDDSMIEVAIAALTDVIPENAEDDRW